jgi:CheY-like chemotaxis protein
VLIVDDRLEMLDLFEDALAASGARVLRATSADEGPHLLRAHEVDALVSDLEMPVRTGHDLVRAIRRMRAPRKREVVAIAVTGGEAWSSVDPGVAVRAGFDFHLVKPVMPDVLVRHVASMIERRRPASGTLPVVDTPGEDRGAEPTAKPR